MRVIFFLCTAAFLLASCRSQDLIRPGDTLDVAFEKAKSLYDDEKYDDAANAFETVISIGRGTDFGQDAQYYLAESYYKDRRYLLAASEYNRYAQFHPNSPRREEVDFKEALSYYHLSPRYRLDQSYTNTAIERFRLFTSRYPNSERIDEAGNYISELREKLAQKKYSAASFYKRTEQYNAAAVYYELVIDQYPDTQWAEKSLVDQMESYILYAENSVPARQEERFEKALESYSRYLQLFPREENRSRVEELYDRAQSGLQNTEGGSSVAQAEDG